MCKRNAECLPCYLAKFSFYSSSLQQKQKLKWELSSGITIFDSEIMFWTKLEITSYGQKHFGEMNIRLCKVTTA